MRRNLRASTRRVVVAGMVASLSGCFWTVPGQNAGRQGFNSLEDQITVATVSDLAEAWEADLGDRALTDPVTSWTGVHVSDGGSLHSIDPISGAVQWHYDAPAPRGLGQPFVREATVLVGESWADGQPLPDESVFRTVELDAGSGAVTGEVPAGTIQGLRGSRAVVVDGSWFRFGILQPIWAYLYSWSVVDLDTGPSGDGRLLDVPPSDATLGSSWLYLWARTPGATLPPQGLRGYDLTTPPGTFCGVVVCSNWNLDEWGDAPVLSTDQATAYFVGTDDPGVARVRALDADTGEIRWSGTLPARATTRPALAHGRLYVPTQAGTVEVFDAAGCGAAACPPLWTASTGAGSAIIEQPAVAGGLVFTGSEDGSLHAFDAAGCAVPPCGPLWAAATGSAITGAPAVSDGQLFVGTADGRLVAYGLAGG